MNSLKVPSATRTAGRRFWIRCQQCLRLGIKAGRLVLLLLNFGVSHAYSVLTQNMAEFSDADTLRIGQLLDRIESQKPDIVFLQEAEAQTSRLIRSKSSFSPYRAIYQESGSIPSAGLIILARKIISPSAANYIELPSEMGRGLLLSTVNLCGKKITLVDLHLESPDILFWRSNTLRRIQIEELKRTLAGRDDFIIAGDWNFVFDNNGEKLIPADWVDTWLKSHPNDPGLTWDPKTNRKAWWAGGFILPGYRLDRVIFKSDYLTDNGVKLIGADNTERLSDHYTLTAKLTCQALLGKS